VNSGPGAGPLGAVAGMLFLVIALYRIRLRRAEIADGRDREEVLANVVTALELVALACRHSPDHGIGVSRQAQCKARTAAVHGCPHYPIAVQPP